MVVLDASIVNIALPSMQRELHFSSASLEWVINAYALAFGGLLLLGGRLGDLYGRKKLFVIGIVIFTLASFAGGLATSQLWLISARVIQGVGGAIASPAALSLVTDNFPEGKPRAKAMGVYAAMSGTGAALGLLLGGVLTDFGSWRWVMFVNVPIGVVLSIVASKVLHKSDTKAGGLDLPGAVSVTLAATLLVYGLSHASTSGWKSSVTEVTLAASVALWIAFFFIESRSTHPLVPLRILASRNRSGALALMLSIGASLFGMFFFLTLFIQDFLRYSPLKAGFAFLPVSIAIVAAAGATSQLVTRFGPRVFLLVGPFVAAIGLMLLTRITPSSTYLTGVLGPMLVLALGAGMTFVPLTLTAVAGVAKTDGGIASAVLNTTQQIGGSIGLAVLVTVSRTAAANKVTSLLHRAIASSPTHSISALTQAVLVSKATISGFDTAFWASAIIAILGFVVAAVFIRVKRDDLNLEGAALPL